MLIKLLLTLLITYCTYSFAAEKDSAAPVIQGNEIVPVDLTTPETPLRPIITPEEMANRLEDAPGTMVKIDKNGEILTSDAARWDCLHNKSSGLTWEIKKTSGLRDKTNTYTWTVEDPQQNGLFTWFEHMQGKCTGNARCETSDYVYKINQLRLCNFSDWRLPTKAELESLIILNRSKGEATIDFSYFPNTLASWYWTADSNENHPEFAWYILFKNGVTLSDKKHKPKHLRLVRGAL